MIRGTIRTLAVMAALCLPATAWAAGTSGSALANTLRALAVLKTDDLEFGTLIASATPGTATINPNSDARTVAGGVTGAGGSTPRAAHFTAVGAVNAVALVTLPGSVTLTRGGGSETMTVTAISSNGPTLRLFPGSATIDIAVSGTLSVAANQVPGAYAGTFTVNVLYF